MSGPAPPTSSDLVISGPLPCIKCAYDLNTCAIGSPCPECGNPTALSMESLWLEDPAYLRRLRRGLNRMVFAALLGPVVCVLGFLSSFLGIERYETAAMLAFGGGMAIGPLLAWHGADLLSSARPGREHLGVGLRVGTRVTAAAYATIFAFVAFLPALRTLEVRSYEELMVGGVFVAGELWCARNVLVLAQITSLAQISNMPRLAIAAPVFQVWAVLLAIFGAGFSFVILGGIRGRAPMLIAVPYGVVAFGVLIWLGAWPIYLARFGHGLKRMLREMERRGRPAIIPRPSGPDVPNPTAPPKA